MKDAQLAQVLRAITAALANNPAPALPARPPFDWEAYERLYAEQVAAWTPEQHEAAAAWYTAALGDTEARPPLSAVVAAEQAYIGVLREHEGQTAKQPANSGGGNE